MISNGTGPIASLMLERIPEVDKSSPSERRDGGADLAWSTWMKLNSSLRAYGHLSTSLQAWRQAPS